MADQLTQEQFTAKSLDAQRKLDESTPNSKAHDEIISDIAAMSHEQRREFFDILRLYKNDPILPTARLEYDANGNVSALTINQPHAEAPSDRIEIPKESIPYKGKSDREFFSQEDAGIKPWQYQNFDQWKWNNDHTPPDGSKGMQIVPRPPSTRAAVDLLASGVTAITGTVQAIAGAAAYVGGATIFPKNVEYWGIKNFREGATSVIHDVPAYAYSAFRELVPKQFPACKPPTTHYVDGQPEPSLTPCDESKERQPYFEVWGQ